MNQKSVAYISVNTYVTGNFETTRVRQKLLIKLLIFVAILIAGLVGFYEFMTYERNYTWSKELEYEVKAVSKVHGFDVTQVSEVSVDSIKLPTERKIKIKIQKTLSKVGIMNYGQEFGKKILLTSEVSNNYLVCKSWCLSDHVIGLEIESSNIDQNTLTNIKEDFDRHFSNYKIVWTIL